MIKTPIIYSTNTGALYDNEGDVIGYDLNTNTESEIVKRINAHDDLVKSLQDMVEIVGANYCSNMETKRKYKKAREQLEKCK